jgi:uncharacterized protein YndB with AHSA1/START domain
MLDNTQSSSPSKHDLVFTRVFDAPVVQVWRAWTDPEYVKRWWGPNGFTCPLAEIDFRVGGTSLVCMRAPKEFGGQDLYSIWEYRVIEPMRRIDYVHNLADKDRKKVDPVKLGMPADFPQDLLHSVTFEVVSANQTKMTITEYGWTAGRMMEMSKMGMEQCLDKMAASFTGVHGQKQ